MRVQNLFEERATVYLVMEMLEGQTLTEELKRAPGKKLSEKRIVEIMDALTSALAKVHSRKLYHLDIKPDNIMVTKEGRIVLLDFGAARQQASSSTRNLTGKSSIAFSELYAPPELILEDKANIGSQTDIFEMGMLLHEMLTGEKAPAAMQRYARHKDWQAKLPEPWGGMINAALRMEATDRPSNIETWWGRYHRPGRGGTVPPQPSAPASFREDLDLGRNIKLEMVQVPAGSFMMGSSDGEIQELCKKYGGDWFKREAPSHRVKICQPFYIGKFLITQGQWERVMGKNPSHFKKGTDYPVDSVSWDDAKAFCRKLREETGKKYRLPSEAEWEYACRAGSDTPYYFGDDPNELDKYAWFGDNSGDKQLDTDQIWSTDRENYLERLLENNCRTHPVGEKQPNQFGLYDMHGNVWEWCEDDYYDSYEGAPRDGSARVDGDANATKMLRGGSWHVNPWSCRSANRVNYFRADRIIYFGFRVVCASPALSYRQSRHVGMCRACRGESRPIPAMFYVFWNIQKV